MSIVIKFVAQSNGKANLGYHSQWRMDKENRDPIKEAREIRKLNSKHHLAQEFNKFVTWEQYYAQEIQDDRGMTCLVGYMGSSEKQEILI